MRSKTKRYLFALATIAAPIGTSVLAAGPAQADNVWCVQAGVSVTGPATPTGPCVTTPTDWWEGCAEHAGYTRQYDVEVWDAQRVCYAFPVI